MLSRVYSAATSGIDAVVIEVEVDVASGLPSYTTVGLPDSAVRESRERVRAAVKNSGLEFPTRNITVSLAPADLRKEGSSLDLPIAIGIVASACGISESRLARTCLVGELSLDGGLRPVRGALPIAARARDSGFAELVLPAVNGPEAALVAGLAVRGAETLAAVVEHLRDTAPLPLATPATATTPRLGLDSGLDYADVWGQAHAKRALEVAAAGGHHLIMVGPPGSGKSMLARRLPSILPPLAPEEQLEATKVYSVAGLLPAEIGLLLERPFRAPHHTISWAGLVGGGGARVRPGELSLAHHGVLFLDEMPEFPRQVLEVLRQPLEDGAIRIVRARGSVLFPARVTLVAAMNPCPCGHGMGSARCQCAPGAVSRYRARISGPLLDRIDLHVEVPALPIAEITAGARAPGEGSAAIRARVVAARLPQRARLAGSDRSTNAQLTAAELSRAAALDAPGRTLLERAAAKLELSARAFDRTLRVARTIADLEGSAAVRAHHLAEALQYRGQLSS